MNFSFIWKNHCKSRIFERMENFQNDCCRPWTKKRFKNSCSRQLRIVNAVVSRSSAGQIDRLKSVFLRDKVTLFETMMTTMNEANRDKTKVPGYFFSVMFRLAVLLLNSMSKVIHNRWTSELIRDFKIWYGEAVVRRQIVKILPVTSWRVPVKISKPNAKCIQLKLN